MRNAKQDTNTSAKKRLLKIHRKQTSSVRQRLCSSCFVCFDLGFFHRCFCRLALNIDMSIKSDGLQTCIFIQIKFEIYLYNGVIGNSYINNILMHKYIPAPKHIYCFISVWLSVFLSVWLFVRRAYPSHFSQTNTDIRKLTKWLRWPKIQSLIGVANVFT